MSQNGPTESVFEFELQDFETVPQGQYIGIFKDVQKTHHDQWGDGVMFVFEIVSGEHKGQSVTRIGKPNATKSNATGKMIAGITGSFVPGQKINLRQFVGKPYHILIEGTAAQKTRIDRVWPYKRPTPQSAPVQTEWDDQDPYLPEIPF